MKNPLQHQQQGVCEEVREATFDPLSAVFSSRSVLGIFFMMVGLSLYAISDACVKNFLQSYSLYQTTFLRSFCRCIPLLLVAVSKTGSFSLLLTQHPGRHLVRVGVSISTTYCFMYACSVASLTSIYTLSYTAPIFTLILSALFLKERIDRGKLCAVLGGFIGVVIAMRPGSGSVLEMGALIVLLGSALSAMNKILMRNLSFYDDPLTISMYPNFAVMFVTLPLLFSHWTPIPWEDWYKFAGFGLITALAQYCVARALACTEASRLAPVDYSTLLWAISLDYFHWETLPYVSTLLGASIIIASNCYILRKAQASS